MVLTRRPTQPHRADSPDEEKQKHSLIVIALLNQFPTFPFFLKLGPLMHLPGELTCDGAEETDWPTDQSRKS